jgi:hypothetical protein
MFDFSDYLAQQDDGKNDSINCSRFAENNTERRKLLVNGEKRIDIWQVWT